MLSAPLPPPSDHLVCLTHLNNWLDGQGALPETYSASAVRVFFTQLRRRCQQASSAAALSTSTRVDMALMLIAVARLNTFAEWAGFTNPKEQAIAALTASWDRSFTRMMARLASGQLSYQVKRVIAQEQPSALRSALASFREDLEGRRLGGNTEQAVMIRHDNRLLREDRSFPTGVDFDAAEMAQIPRYIRQDMAEASKNEGWAPNWLPRGHPNLSPILGQLRDEKAREVVWSFTQPDTSRPTELKDLLASRRKQCRRGVSFAEQALSAHAESDPHFVQRILHGALMRLAPAHRYRAKILQQLADAQYGGLDASRPWNTDFLLAAADQAVPALAETRDDLFPVVSTVFKVVPDILRAVGWSCHPRVDLSGELLHFDCQRSDGQKVRLLVRPIGRDCDRLSNFDGIFNSMDQTWLGGQDVLTGGIDLFLPKGTQSLAPEKIAVLAHELGHMVHYLSMPRDGVFGESLFPSDLVEFPSQLLERFVTPERLAGWTRPTASAAYRAPAYWRSTMVTSLELWRLDEAAASATGSSLDLDMHLPGHHSIDGTYNSLRALSGLSPADARTTEHHAAFMWKSDYAARDYIYLWGKFLIDQVLPERSSSAVVAKCFKEFIHHVGSRAVLPQEVSTAWKQWRGETLRRSVTSGAKKWALAVEEKNKHALRSNPLLNSLAGCHPPSPRRAAKP